MGGCELGKGKGSDGVPTYKKREQKKAFSWKNTFTSSQLVSLGLTPLMGSGQKWERPREEKGVEGLIGNGREVMGNEKPKTVREEKLNLFWSRSNYPQHLSLWAHVYHVDNSTCPGLSECLPKSQEGSRISFSFFMGCLSHGFSFKVISVALFFFREFFYFSHGGLSEEEIK